MKKLAGSILIFQILLNIAFAGNFQEWAGSVNGTWFSPKITIDVGPQKIEKDAPLSVLR